MCKRSRSTYFRTQIKNITENEIGKGKHGMNFNTNQMLLEKILEHLSKLDNVSIILEIGEDNYIDKPNNTYDLLNMIKNICKAKDIKLTY